MEAFENEDLLLVEYKAAGGSPKAGAHFLFARLLLLLLEHVRRGHDTLREREEF